MVTVHLTTGPAGSGKTQTLLERYCDIARSEPGSALWLSPTSRSVARVKQSILRRLGGGWGLHVYTFESFVEAFLHWHNLSGRSVSFVQKRLLVEEIITHLDAEGEIDYFEPLLESRGFTVGLFDLLGELKRSGVSPFEFVRAAYRRENDGAEIGRTIHDDSISKKERQCGRIFARYQRELRRRGLLDAEGRFQHTQELIEANDLGPFRDVRTLFVDGYEDFSVPQQRLLQSWVPHLDEVWCTLLDEPSEMRAELFQLPRATRLTLDRIAFRDANIVTTMLETRADRPAGLKHLESQLFLPLRKVETSGDATGIVCIQAPGMVGEARLVARHIKELLLQGIRGDDVLVACRDLNLYGDLLHEVFADYGLPVAVEGTSSLVRNPLVAVLLRSLRLSDEGWPFAGVTALLRNTYFQPDWPEVEANPEVAPKSEALLRLLGEPRGREAYLQAVHRWAEKQQPGLEDEQAEESRRRRTHELAKECLPFLVQFFKSWDDAPRQATVREHIAWVRSFATRIGLDVIATRSLVGEEDQRDLVAWNRLWEEMDAWAEADRERAERESEHEISRRVFLHRLAALISETGVPNAEPVPGAVCILSAESGRHLEAEHLFVVGLGERSFPKLTTSQPFFDDDERLSLQRQAVVLSGSAERMPAEMLLFYQLVTSTRTSLVLSYPAVDERGQELLPSSFLSAVFDCFEPNSIPIQRREMLIERYDKDAPLSLAEYRVRAASLNSFPSESPMSVEVKDNLLDVAQVNVKRLRERVFSVYDGMFRDPTVIAELAQIFGTEKIFSPTALEDYVACPFKFYSRHVLKVEPLEEPREEIEVTRRGQAVHRALARLHQKRQQAEQHDWDEEVQSQVIGEIQLAIDEDVERAPSPAAKQLWRLEGERLLKLTERYPEHWKKFQAPWKEKGIVPQPYFFEVDFGLPVDEGQVPYPPLIIRADDIEVRISGRIDRVDCAKLEDGEGFWIIDYKTGRAGNYTSPDLTKFRKLQLTLYALAVEEVLLRDKNARPLGLAYWMVTDNGAKVCLPERKKTVWLEETDGWLEIRQTLQRWILTLVRHIRSGDFPLQPQHDDCTLTCSFGQMCRITQARSIEKETSRPTLDDGSIPRAMP